MNDAPPPPSIDEDERAALLRRDGMLLAIALVSLLNGMHFSPYFDPVFVLMRPFAPAFFISSPILLFYLTSLTISIFVVVLAGVPAALFERATGRTRSDVVSLGIWLIGTIIIGLPGIRALFG